MTLKSINAEITKARTMFNKDGLLATFKGELWGHGPAPKSAREAAASVKKCRKNFADDRDRVIAWLRGRGKKKGVHLITLAEMFGKMEAHANVNDWERRQGYGVMNDEVEPGVIVPICHACGSRAPKDKRDYYHWHTIRRDLTYFQRPDGKGWEADAGGVMCHSLRLYDVIVFLYVMAVVSENDDFAETYANAELIG